MGQKISGRKRAKAAENVEDAETIRIDSSPLHCPVCMQVFAEAPEILSCGHSFCSRCLDGTVRAVLHYQPQDDFFECPLCRFHHHRKMGRGVRNFTVEAILDSIQMKEKELLEPAKEIELCESEQMARMRISMKRMLQQNRIMEGRIATYKLRSKNQRKMITALGLVLLGSLCYKLLAGSISLLFSRT